MHFLCKIIYLFWVFQASIYPWVFEQEIEKIKELHYQPSNKTIKKIWSSNWQRTRS